MNQSLGTNQESVDVVKLHDLFDDSAPSQDWAEAAVQGPPGAQVCAEGVRVAVAAQHATAVELCLFDAAGEWPTRRVRLHGPEKGVFHGQFHGLVRGAGPGLVYALRVHGSDGPGRRFDPHRLLLDPYAKQVVGRLGSAATAAPRARVPAPVAPAERTPRPPRPHIAPAERVLYELHAKGFSMGLPGLPDALRGSWAALAHPAAIAHFKALGVTTLSLLPVMQHLDEPFLAAGGRSNHWGYNTLAFFCPDRRFATRPEDPDASDAEFRALVDVLHAAGLEIVLDIVFNHTPEGGAGGPLLSWRGLDEAGWYRLDAQGLPIDYSACGNSPDLSRPLGAQFVQDVLRHWVQVMGVDGFRFDLAPALGRGPDGHFDARAPLLQALRDDPVLADTLFIAEAWDSGPQPYQVGRFLPPWLDWNDRFRDAARGFWLGAPGFDRRRFAAAFDASAVLFGARGPLASVNFVSAHDGFTLADLVSHSRKHNQANGQDNRDGRDDELCANFGVEGRTDGRAVYDTRQRVQRALLATLCLAAGTPMLCAGDETGNSQGGNNNAWNQDNATGWLDWPPGFEVLRNFAAGCLALRREFDALRPADAAQIARRRWLHLDDVEQALALHIDSAGLCLVFNPGPSALPLPAGTWRLRLCSDGSAALPGGTLPPRSLALLQATRSPTCH